MSAPGRVCTFKPCVFHANAANCKGEVCNGFEFFKEFCTRCNGRKICVLRNALGKDDGCVIRLYYALYTENLELKAKVRKLQREARKAAKKVM
jgi:hypothetical protein